MPTDFQRGIIVFIDKDEFDLNVRQKSGFLHTEYYPEDFTKLMLPGELGRFLMFRFFLKENQVLNQIKDVVLEQDKEYLADEYREWKISRGETVHKI